MTDKTAQGPQEHTFLGNGKVYYHMISEDRIREIIREEITEYIMEAEMLRVKQIGLSDSDPRI
tara:strand:- start:139 stop:327 length:189 start_codon:yes stop_codon:yes gene_type:complete